MEIAEITERRTKNWMQRRCLCVLRVLYGEKPQKSEISCLQFTHRGGPLPRRTSLLKLLQEEAKAKKKLQSCNMFDNTFVSFVAFCEKSSKSSQPDGIPAKMVGTFDELSVCA